MFPIILFWRPETQKEVSRSSTRVSGKVYGTAVLPATRKHRKTPKDEAVLLQAGLGRRTINLADGADHTEVSLKDKSTINSEDIIEVFHLTFQIT